LLQESCVRSWECESVCVGREESCKCLYRSQKSRDLCVYMWIMTYE
jgi:hypothetical protein